ncbi:ATP-binding protein [Pedobacter sp. UBA5917]|jgi:predicted AAA+ superfamily ATPase|uniref:ATP-binding protein n=1 Tax=Pedobacter sp. UBA5917 TaxID=1947061 RepID=UPI0025D99EE8|nr:ATP-binding protein [Pedobacter sp. UBA5917]
MQQLVNRNIIKHIQDQKSKFPIIALTGPRQSGKTTLLKNIFKDYRYISLENPDVRAFATEDPNGFLNEYNDKVIFDEVQRVPLLFSYLQSIVDESKIMGQFILSGSQNFHLMRGITQSLAGRVALFKLLPFDLTELKTNNLLEDSYATACVKGFYPAIYDRDIQPSVYFANYIQTYVEKDVTELLNIKDLRTFRTFIGLCANQAGQLLNLSSLANDCNISQPTAKSWLSVLESSYIIYLLQPYYENFNKRLVKTPKLYFYDTGLLCHLLKINTSEALTKNRLKGNIFENMVIAEFQKQNYHNYLNNEYYFWQDSNANEIDLLEPTSDGYSIFEIKATQTVTPDLFKNMDKFEANANPKKVEKTLIYGGLENQKRSKHKVLSWKSIEQQLI